MTTGNIGGSVGFFNGGSNGSFSSSRFVTVGGTDYEVYSLYLQLNQIQFRVRQSESDTRLPAWNFVLRVGTSTFNFHGHNDYDSVNNRYIFNAPGVGWTVGQMLTASLSEKLPTISIDSPSVDEPAPGERTTLRFTVTRSGRLSGTASVRYFRTGGVLATATHGVDFTGIPTRETTLTFQDGESEKYIDATIIGDDDMNEPDETIRVGLTGVVNATFPGGGTSPIYTLGTIRNYVEPPTLTLEAPDPVVEGDPGEARKEMKFTARLSHAYTRDVTFEALLNPSRSSANIGGIANPATATPPSNDDDVLEDFNATTFTIPANQTEATVSAWVVGDDREEEDETFTLVLTRPTNTAHSSTWSTSATGTIVDDDGPLPVLSVSTARIREGDAGSNARLPFEVNLSESFAVDVTVNYALDAGRSTATVNEDYVALAAGTLTFKPGERRHTIEVKVVGNTVQETRYETVVLTFSNPVNATFSGGSTTPHQATGTIRDDDGDNESANTEPVLSRVGFSGEDKDGVYRQRQSGWKIVAGTRFSPGYDVVDRDDAHWDRNDDDVHDVDGEEVEDGAGLKWSRMRQTAGTIEPVDVGYGRLVAPNVSAKQVKDGENCMTFTAEAGDYEDDFAEPVEAELCVVPRPPTVILRGLEGWRVKEGKEAHVNAGHSFGGFRPRYQREYDENGKLLPAPDGKKEMHELGLTYAWSQVSGDFSPDMEFPNGANGNQMTFTAPQVERPTVLTFEVTATDSLGATLSEEEKKKHQTTRRISYTILDTNDPPVGQAYMEPTGRYSQGCPLYKLDGSGSWDPNYDTTDPDNPPNPDDKIVSWRFVLAADRDGNGNPTGVLAEVVSDTAVKNDWMPPRVERDTRVALFVYPADGKGLEGRHGNAFGTYTLRARDFANCTGAPDGTPPTVDAGADLDVKAGTKVTLEGRGQAHPDDVRIDRYGNRVHDLTYTWEQVSSADGVAVTLSAVTTSDHGATAEATFTAPSPTATERLVFRLKATDEDGESASDLVAVTVSKTGSEGGDPTQLQPVFSLLFADAGPDREARPGATVTLGPVEAAPEGVEEPASRQWTQLAGPEVTLSDAAARNPTFPVPGDASPGTVYEFELEVTDGLGGSAWDVAAVTVLEGTPPTASAGPDLEALPGTTVTLQGRSSTNPHGRWYDMAHRWVQHEGPVVQLSDPTKGDPSFAVPAGAAVGTAYRFVLTVTDAEGETDADSVTVTVVAALSATPPTANAGPDLEAAPGETVTLQGNGSTNPHGKWWRMAHLWTQTKGPDVTLSDPTKGLPSFTVPADAAPGTVFGFELKVTDKDGETDTDAMTVTVPGGVPVTADAGPDLDVEPGATATLGAETDAVEGWTYAWTRASGPEVTLTGADTPRASFAVPADAADGTIYGFALTVTDAHGNTATDVATATVSATPVLTVEAPSVTEGGPGARTAMAFTLRLDRASTRTLSPRVRVTASGSAAYRRVDDPASAEGGDGTDVVGRARADRHAAGTATFAPGETEATLTFTVLGDATFEEDETLAVEFLPVHGLALPGAAPLLLVRGTIVNDDTAPEATADAGPDLEVAPGATATLGAEAEATDGWTYAWTQASGPEVTLQGADAPQASFAVPADAADGTAFGFTLTVTDAAGGTATDDMTVTVVRPASACTTELGSLGVGGSADRGGEYWDNPDCSAHHRADRPARYFRFTLTERATVAVDVTTDATAALFVSKGTPKNGWGTPAKAGMAHRLKVRRDNGKLVHGAALSASMVLAAGEYTAEAVLDADGPEAWRVPSFSLSLAATAPPTLSVADARVQEAPGATLSFAVTLDPPAAGPVTVDYATADGTATAGADYEAASGTLTFQAGETSKTVSVTVLDDAHDEGEETMTLTLSDAVGAVLGDAEATGTIANTDAVPEAWLARFGRTVAERHVAAVQSRLDADRSPGFSGRFAGQPLPGPAAGADGTGLGPDPLRESRTATPVSPSGDAVLALRAPAVPEIPELSEDELLAFRSLLADDGEDDPETTALASDDVLLGTSFAMMQDSGTGLSTGFWGSASRAGFSGRDGETDLDGEVTSVMLGTDWKRKGTLFGLMVSGSRGTGTYKGASPGEIDARLTALVPYAGLGIGEGFSAWVAAGTGTGEMTLAPEGADPVTADIGWSMAAAGAGGDLAPGARLGGADLGWHGDALWTRTTSDAAAGLAASAGDTVRLRLGLQAAWEQTLASGLALRPRLEMGLRHDGGDAETGSGLEIGGGLGIGDSASGLSMSFDGRTLALHEDGAFESWGLGVSVAWDPRPETRRGWSLAARGSLGTTSGGVDALLGPEAFPGLESGGEGDWSVEAAYGTGRGYGMVGSPYARTGGSGGPRLGWRVEPDADHAADASVDFWAGSGTDGDGRGAGAELQWRW